ncbi:MAG TPA: hypothetical protein VLJ68_04780 [Chitinophagaceae bacterium]|nr:hypothetical protein [Chitinophagaceae bacterium]
MDYLLFVAYLVLFAWLVTRVKFFTRSGLSQPQLVIVFLLKVMAGIFYGWIGLYYGNLAQMTDTWSFHNTSIQEYHLLGTHPGEYFTNLFHNPYQGGFEKFFTADESYWNDLKGNVFVKILSIFNIISFGNYYVNVIFYTFLSLFGPFAIYRVMTDVFPSRKLPVLIATFLVPSFLYWTSGLHKDGLIFLGISLIIYHLYFGWKEKKYGFKRIGGIILGLLLLLSLRNFLFVIIIPGIIAWILSIRWPKRSFVIYSSVYLFFLVMFFTLRYVSPKFDFPQAVVNKQQEFMKLKSKSMIPIEELQPNVLSFIKNTPQAINLSTIRPYPSDVRHILSLAAAIEIDLLLLMFVLFIFCRIKGSPPRNLVLFCVFFSFSLLLAIGFSVNNLGAIVRYRSIIIPLLIIPMAAQIDWARLSKLLLNNIKNKNNVSNSS